MLVLDGFCFCWVKKKNCLGGGFNLINPTPNSAHGDLYLSLFSKKKNKRVDFSPPFFPLSALIDMLAI